MNIYINPKLTTILVGWAARHEVSVQGVAEKAIAEYLADCDAGLLSSPPAELRSLLGRGLTDRGYRRRGATG